MLRDSSCRVHRLDHVESSSLHIVLHCLWPTLHHRHPSCVGVGGRLTYGPPRKYVHRRCVSDALISFSASDCTISPLPDQSCKCSFAACRHCSSEKSPSSKLSGQWNGLLGGRFVRTLGRYMQPPATRLGLHLCRVQGTTVGVSGRKLGRCRGEMHRCANISFCSNVSREILVSA
jgi:hypothetical protein